MKYIVTVETENEDAEDLITAALDSRGLDCEIEVDDGDGTDTTREALRECSEALRGVEVTHEFSNMDSDKKRAARAAIAKAEKVLGAG